MRPLLLSLVLFNAAQAAPMQLAPLGDTPHVWQRADFSLTGIAAAQNNFDPDEIAVDVTFSAANGTAQTLPAFWFQDYSRQLNDKNTEVLTPVGAPGWRVRWTPLASGAHRWKITVTGNGQSVTGEGTLQVGAKVDGSRGFARVEPQEKRYFQTDDGAPLPLFGEDVCWHHARGTYDYDDWFAGYRKAGMNYTRLWQSPWSFNAEFFPGERLNYNQQRLWQLDYVLAESANNGVFTMLCMDYHGVFQSEKDMWGGGDYWAKHAYNKVNGGPCVTQNDWFTNAEAEKLYRKRLRYLVARYSSFPSLFSWQFFNEINNVYSKFKPADCVAWHDRQAQWLKAHDPYKHLVTTSFGSDGDDPAMWNLASLDYANYHWYGNWGGKYSSVTQMTSGVAQDFRTRYGKPVVIAEFGTHGGGSKENRAADPQKRGLVQAMWGGIFSGTAGATSPWWWEQNHEEGNYYLWGALKNFLDGTGFGSAAWHPMEASGPKMSIELGTAVAGGAPFDIKIATSGSWGAKTKGVMAINAPSDAAASVFLPHIHGNSKPDLKNPFIVQANLAAGARLTIHVNSVSSDAILAVKADGKEIFRRALPNKDGKWEVNDEYNEDVEVALPNGTREVEVFNPGGDWIAVDWVRLNGVTPSRSPQKDGVPLDVWAQSDGKMALVYAVDPRYNWPRGRDGAAEKLSGAVATVRGLPDGNYRAQWFATRDAKPIGETVAKSMGGEMKLPVVPFEVDAAARVLRD